MVGRNLKNVIQGRVEKYPNVCWIEEEGVGDYKIQRPGIYLVWKKEIKRWKKVSRRSHTRMTSNSSSKYNRFPMEPIRPTWASSKS